MESLQLSLEPRDKPEEQIINESLTLAQIIPRITQERGAFANLSEDDLLREIEEDSRSMDVDRSNDDLNNEDQKLKVEGEDEIMGDDNAEEVQAEEQEFEDEKHSFDESRRKLVDLVNSAMNESALSLDFISLLLSCLRPAAGTASMSPLLKELVGVGSLAADALTNSIPEESPRIGTGWKLQSLSKAANGLRSAAKRLKNEVGKEETYWQSIYDIVNAGEVLFKIRKGDARGLGIKYGFGDAGSEYKDKGVAFIKRKIDGSMSFKFDMNKRRHVLRVGIYENSSGEWTRIGYSQYKGSLEPELDVQAQIRNARKIIFEEELFYEIVREARRLAAYRVQVVDGKVIINLHDQILEIDHVDPMVVDEDEDLYPTSAKADLICSAFKILLCDAHRINLERRRNDPAPLNTRQPERKIPMNVLRPLIVHLHHAKLLRRTSRLLEMILQDRKNVTVDLKTYIDEKDASRLGRLLEDPISVYSIKGENFEVQIETSSPMHSDRSLFKAMAKSSEGSLVSRAELNEVGELEEWINWILKRN